MKGISRNNQRATRRLRWLNLACNTGVHAGAVVAFLPGQFLWSSVAACVVLQFVTGGLGINLGYHRLISHRSFRTYRPLEYSLAWLGSLSMQGGPITWVAIHRLHHARSDQPGDPHSPRDGFFWAYAGWFLLSEADRGDMSRLVPDLMGDKWHLRVERYQAVSHAVLAAALFAIGGWSLFLWGFCVRIAVTVQMASLLNSAAHRWGYRSFKTGDDSRNLWWLALLTWGEGWHNNHHAFPRSARHGLRAHELDAVFLVIRCLSWVGLAWDVRTPSASQRNSRAGT